MSEPEAAVKGGAGSKEQVLADLAAERSKRQQAETQVQQLQRDLTQAQETHQAQIADLTAKFEDAEKVAAEASLRAERAETLRSKGVPSELDEFISGTNADEIAVSADRALQIFSANRPGGDESPKPLGMRPDGTQGADTVALNSDAIESGLRAALNI